ncbi:hypothetical protein VNO77_32878 [Canavalia gladiata]|uniref:phospholipase A2 n=1 Tax=Canavalia gladiata TaxID=3824 RepID=A0AAN9PZX1_CANGL
MVGGRSVTSTSTSTSTLSFYLRFFPPNYNKIEMVVRNISRASAAIGIFLCLLLVTGVPCSGQENCSTQCIAMQCDTIGIKYGKYCGVGYSGCPGEKPCDDLDACCMVHDECVGKFGMTNVKCHKKLKNCLIKVQNSGKVGFSKECPYTTAAPTMIRGMDLAILLSQLDDGFNDL